MNKLVTLALTVLLLAGCGVLINPDGIVDESEQSYLNLAAGVTLGNHPELVAPVYSISEKLLVCLEASTESVSVSALDTKMLEFAEDQGFTESELVTAKEAYAALKVTIISNLNSVAGELPEGKTYIMKAVAEAMYQAAGARL